MEIAAIFKIVLCRRAREPIILGQAYYSQSSKSGGTPVNVRWDAVVDRSLWHVDGPAPPTDRAERGPAGPVRIQIRLFGALGAVTARRGLDLVLPRPASLRDVLAAAGRELGEAFRARVLDPAGDKLACCRVFVDGALADRLDAPVGAGEAAQVEIILLTGLEGG